MSYSEEQLVKSWSQDFVDKWSARTEHSSGTLAALLKPELERVYLAGKMSERERIQTKLLDLTK